MQELMQIKSRYTFPAEDNKSISKRKWGDGENLESNKLCTLDNGKREQSYSIYILLQGRSESRHILFRRSTRMSWSNKNYPHVT